MRLNRRRASYPRRISTASNRVPGSILNNHLSLPLAVLIRIRYSLCVNSSNNQSNNQSWKVSAAEADTRLDKWLAAPDRLGSRSKSLTAIERGKIFVNEAEQTTADTGRKLQEGDTVRLWMDRPGSATRRYAERRSSGLHLLYEDSSLLVVNKVAGLLAVPLASQPDEESLFDQVKFHLRSHGNRDPLVVHRIDRDTSGLIVFAKTGEAQHKLKEQFERREPERVYLAAVHGHPTPEAGVWKDLLELQDSQRHE